jgi:hypothetical protein
MGFTPNRLEANWERIKPLILQEWPRLTEAELQQTEKQFDHLVHLIRETYGGRVDIVQEADIRTTLNNLLARVEG